MAQPTILQLGAWNTLTDGFTFHPTSPTGAILNLNDGAVFSLVDDDSGLGVGLNLGATVPDIYETGNPRTVGQYVTRINYGQHRQIVARLLWGQGTIYSSWITALHNLAALCAGITPQQPATLQIQVAGASTPIYADVLAAYTNIAYKETLWNQLIDDEVVVVFTCRPFLRGQRQYLSNLVSNPGFETPDGPGVLVFSDSFANANAYDPQQYVAAVTSDAPLRWYQLDEVRGTTAVDAGSAKISAAYTGGVTLAQQPGPMGGADYAILLDGSTGYLAVPTTGLPSGNSSVTLECWFLLSALPGATARLAWLGTSPTAGQFVSLQLTTAGGLQAANGGVTTTASASVSLNVWHHGVVVYDTVNLSCYLDGALVNAQAYSTANITLGQCSFGCLGAGSASFFSGKLDECAVYSTALSSTRVSAHYSAGRPAQLTLSPANTYVDVVLANVTSLLRYYRVGEASGTTAYDIAGTAANGTYSATGITLASLALVFGDSLKGATFSAATSGKVTCTAGGNLPTGNNAFSYGAVVQFSANPSSLATIGGFGASGSKTGSNLWIDTSGHANCDLSGNAGLVTSTAALATGTPHLVVVTWDGTTLHLYVDGTSTGTPTTPGANAVASNPALFIGANNSGGSNFFNGIIQDFFFCGAALSATQVTNIWNAAHSGATGTVANALAIPSGARCQFGSPAWGAINTWRVRFRWVTGSVPNLFLHYTDASNYLMCSVSGSSMSLNQAIGGTNHVLATVSATLTHESYYWLQLTQFPSVAGDPPYVQVVLNADAAGAVGTQIATGAGNTFDALTALSGSAQISASGATLVVGGVTTGSNVGHQVLLFGPGAWLVQQGSSATGNAAGGWEQNTANTYTGGPVTSYGAARLDLPLAGAADAYWTTNFLGGTSPVGTMAIPIATDGNVLGVSAVARSLALSASAQLYLRVVEYDASGTFLRGNSVGTLTGNQTSWTVISGTYTTGASCAYVALQCRVTDTSGGSAGGVVWFDNVQVWNQTTTNQTSMPYCELRFPQAPAQLLVSGLLGDVPAPAFLALGTSLVGDLNPISLTLMVGRRAQASANAQLVSAGYYIPGNGGLPTLYALDSTCWGGYKLTINDNTNLNGTTFSFHPSDMTGTYRHISRMLTNETTPTLGGNVEVYGFMGYVSQPWYGPADQSAVLYNQSFTIQYPFALGTAAIWQPVDIGGFTVPATLLGALTDATQFWQTMQLDFIDMNVPSATSYVNWSMLLPVDGEILTGTVAAANGYPSARPYGWVYIDGLAVQRGAMPAWGLSAEAKALANPAQGVSGPNVDTGVAWAVNPAGDPYVRLDPTLRPSSSASAVNQFVGLLTDFNGAVLPLFAELAYTPLFLFPQ